MDLPVGLFDSFGRMNFMRCLDLSSIYLPLKVSKMPLRAGKLIINNTLGRDGQLNRSVM